MLAYGIVGLPNAGKSTLFNALTKGSATVAAYPFCTIEPNVGIVPVPDPRLEALAQVIQPDKVTPATLKFVDIAGLVRGASQGEGLGNQFLAHIREADAVAHVVRFFDDDNVAHVDGEVDPQRDVETVETELLMADLETVEKRIDKTEPVARTSRTAEAKEELAVLKQLRSWLQSGRPARLYPDRSAHADLFAGLFLLSDKPVLYVANVDEEQVVGWPEDFEDFLDFVRQRGSQVVPACARLESELNDLDEAEAKAFLQEYGLEASGLERLVQAGYQALDLVTFYTVKGPETRAWSVPRHTPAPVAAGKIHSDMQRGFIKAEVIGYQELLDAGSFSGAREQGLVRSEGRTYEIQDGDVVLFRFNVSG